MTGLCSGNKLLISMEKKKQQLYRLIKIYLGPDTGTSSREIPAISCVVPYFPHRPCSLDFCTVQPTQYYNDTSNRWAVGVKLGAWLKGKNLNITYMNSALMKCWFSAWPLRGLLFRLNAELNIEITKCRERRRSKLPWFFKLARKGPRASALPFKGLHLIRILQQTEIQQNKIKTPERQVNEYMEWQPVMPPGDQQGEGWRKMSPLFGPWGNYVWYLLKELFNK